MIMYNIFSFSLIFAILFTINFTNAIEVNILQIFLDNTEFTMKQLLTCINLDSREVPEVKSHKQLGCISGHIEILVQLSSCS